MLTLIGYWTRRDTRQGVLESIAYIMTSITFTSSNKLFKWFLIKYNWHALYSLWQRSLWLRKWFRSPSNIPDIVNNYKLFSSRILIHFTELTRFSERIETFRVFKMNANDVILQQNWRIFPDLNLIPECQIYFPRDDLLWQMRRILCVVCRYLKLMLLNIGKMHCFLSCVRLKTTATNWLLNIK